MRLNNGVNQPYNYLKLPTEIEKTNNYRLKADFTDETGSFTDEGQMLGVP